MTIDKIEELIDDNNQNSNICCVNQNDIYVEESTTAVITPENNNIDISITTDNNLFQESEEKIITPQGKIKKLLQLTLV